MTIQFVEVDAQALYNSLILQFQAALNEVFYPGDERRIFIEQETQIIVALYNAINETGKQNLLRYARGDVLDALGERTDTPRIPAQAATTTFRFTLSSAQAFDVMVPAGTRGTPDGVLFFSSEKDLVITAGQIYGDMLAIATVTGETHNGFIAGQINQMVDPVPYVASVANIDTCSGGADTEPDDDGVNIWSGYRERIRQAPSKFSTAGPEDAYIYWAKTADVNILDVVVTSPAAGEIKITVLMQDGAETTQAILDKVLAVCGGKKVRPLTDNVTAAAPVESPYDITLTYYISEADAASEAGIRSAIEDSGGAVDQYEVWQGSKLGRAINPDYLRQLMLNAGAYRITLTAPAYTEVAEDAVATAGTVTITYGGLE